MSDPAVKRRLARAKARAGKMFRCLGYSTIPSDNSTFCMLGVRDKEIRMVRVVIDQITEDDIKAVRGFRDRPPSCTCEVWCKKINKSMFEMKRVD